MYKGLDVEIRLKWTPLGVRTHLVHLPYLPGLGPLLLSTLGEEIGKLKKFAISFASPPLICSMEDHDVGAPSRNLLAFEQLDHSSSTIPAQPNISG